MGERRGFFDTFISVAGIGTKIAAGAVAKAGKVVFKTSERFLLGAGQTLFGEITQEQVAEGSTSAAVNLGRSVGAAPAAVGEATLAVARAVPGEVGAGVGRAISAGLREGLKDTDLPTKAAIGFFTLAVVGIGIFAAVKAL